jgi:hypothetical protein
MSSEAIYGCEKNRLKTLNYGHRGVMQNVENYVFLKTNTVYMLPHIFELSHQDCIFSEIICQWSEYDANNISNSVF